MRGPTGRVHVRSHNRLPRSLRRTIYAAIGALVLSGLGWLLVTYLLASPDEPRPAPHPWAGTLLMAHGVAAYIGLFACALAGHAHIRVGWHTTRMRPVGTLLLVALALLTTTGLVFYYSGNDQVVEVSRWAHVAAGVVLPLVLLVHILAGRGSGR